MPPLDTDDAVERLATGTDLIDLLRTSAQLAATAGSRGAGSALTSAVVELSNLAGLATLAAIETLGALDDPAADARLHELLGHPEPLVARHAAWRAAATAPAVGPMVHLAHRATLGGIDTLHAHRTLRRWARDVPRQVVAAVGRLLPSVESPDQRARLVDVLGVIEHPTADAALLLLAGDRSEALAARLAAIAALGHRRVGGATGLLEALARGDDELAVQAAFALDDLASRSAPGPAGAGGGLRVAQLTLAGHLDPGLQEGGRGDTGGVASLLVSLGQALADRPEVAEVLTIGRGRWEDVVAVQPSAEDDRLHYATLPVGDDARPWTTPAASWEHFPAIERGLTSILGGGQPIDVLHLRMADVGTLAAADVANRLGIAVCFSLAPDPHGLIRAQQQSGQLDRSSFLRREEGEHLWFRARLVERLARDASRLALFPRRHDGELFRDLGVTPSSASLVVPEGIDIGELRRAEDDLDRELPTPMQPGGDVLDELASRIPADRRDLPLLVSVGRLQPVKGMDRVVRAWAADPERWRSSNLIIVGGDLGDPSAAERSILQAIDAAVGPDHPARPGLILCGGRPRRDVARLLAASVAGRSGAWAPGGVYVNGAYKEEFGLALLEALALGLPVVAPSTGGPPTFVDHDETGILVDVDGDLGAGIDRAFELVGRPGRVDRARTLVENRYSIERMADRLIELYQPAGAVVASS